MLVRFTNVGRKSTCWDAELPNVDTATVLREVKRRVRFATKYISIEYDRGRNIGDVVAGIRTVGSFVVVQSELS